MESSGRQPENPLLPTGVRQTAGRPHRYDQPGDFPDFSRTAGGQTDRHHAGSEGQKSVRRQMPKRDHNRAKTGVAGKRVGPLQIRSPRTVACGLSSYPHAAERQRGLSGPGILSPDRRRLHSRTPPWVHRKRRGPRLGLLQKARDRNRA